MDWWVWPLAFAIAAAQVAACSGCTARWQSG